MSNYLDLPILELNKRLLSKEITPTMLVEESLNRIDKSNLNALITVDKEGALGRAKELENEDVTSLLYGIPIIIKDNIITKNLRTTCASKMLENFIPPYDATVVEKIKKEQMIIIGKANMDEFAMGSTSRSSYFSAPKNPWDNTKITGGSSGGSASAVAEHLTPFALGTDTGGSIRQPASYCGIVGMKPTYGLISRYGLVAFASSLDAIGSMTRNVYDNALLCNILACDDEFDLTSIKKEKEDYTRFIGQDIRGMKVGVPNYFMSDIVNVEIKEEVEKVISILKNSGVTVEYIDIAHLDQAVTLYQIIAMSEASSNLSRFDGVRYGYSTENPLNLEELYQKTREEGFGDEVKRRIMIGSYLLSGENATTYYDKALQIRDDMKKSFSASLEKYDFIIGPTTTTTAYGLEESLDDAMKSFMDDVLVIPVNMAGLPALSLPIGFDSDKMPIGLHIIGARLKEAKIYQLASFIETKLNLDLDPRGRDNNVI